MHTTIDPVTEARDSLAVLVDALADLDASASTLAAARTQLVDLIRTCSEIVERESGPSTPNSRDLAFRSVRAEVACVLRLPERTVEGMLGEARFLLRSLPSTMQALRAGEITYRHAQVIADQAAGLEGDSLATFERLAVAAAFGATPTALDRRARKLREGLEPRTIAERTREAVERREVTWSPGRDGMGWLTLYLSAVDGTAIYSRATDAALALRTVEASSEHPRTLAQLRLDVLRDGFLAGALESREGHVVRADVCVTVPVFSLMGLTDEPADLEGYGPIDAETARRLGAHAPSFVRLLVHPFTGAVLGVDRDRYSAPSDLRTAARVRDGVCGFLGCNQPARRCDLDHTVDWQFGGKTELSNLAHLCRGHHTLKHHTPWKVKQDPGGTGMLTWTSPTGRDYVKVPESRARPPELPPF